MRQVEGAAACDHAALIVLNSQPTAKHTRAHARTPSPLALR